MESADSFQEAFHQILVLGNFVGFPASGNFSWRSVSAIYSLFLLLASLLLLLMYCCWISLHGQLTLNKFVTLTVFARNVGCLLSFQRLAQKWPLLMAKWKAVDVALPAAAAADVQLKKRLRLLMLLVISASTRKLIARFKAQKLTNESPFSS